MRLTTGGALADLRAATTRSQLKRIMFICNSLGFYKPYFSQKRGDLSTSKYLKSIETKNKLTVFENLYQEWKPAIMIRKNGRALKPGLRTSLTRFRSIGCSHAKWAGDSFILPLSIYDRGWGCSWNDRSRDTSAP